MFDTAFGVRYRVCYMVLRRDKDVIKSYNIQAYVSSNVIHARMSPLYRIVNNKSAASTAPCPATGLT